MQRSWLARVLAVSVAVASVLAIAPPAFAGYPFHCPKQTVLVINYDDPNPNNPTPAPFATIQAAVEAANGDPAGSGVGDTVIVCPGTYNENVDVPVTDGNSNNNLTIRSFDDMNKSVVVGAPGEDAVFDIDAPGVTLGGPGLGLIITGASQTGVQVGTEMPIDFDQDDDQEITECDLLTGECDDEEIPAFDTTNVTIVGNRIEDLAAPEGVLQAIAVNNSNNTLVFRNLIEDLSVGGDGIAYGIRFSDTNYNNDVVENAIKKVTQTGTGCTDSTLAEPSAGAVAISVEDEALDGLAHENLIERIESSCTAIGVYSDAWGGLENTRNGQQIPIATTVLDNRIKKISSAAADQAAGVVLAPIVTDNNEDHNDPTNPPSSFRVMANDIDDTQVAVAVLTQMASNSYVRENDFDNDVVGVLNAGNENLDATNNWWGCSEGPASGKCATVVNSGGGTTWYTPWLKHHVDHAGKHAGEHAGHN